MFAAGAGAGAAGEDLRVPVTLSGGVGVVQHSARATGADNEKEYNGRSQLG